MTVSVVIRCFNEEQHIGRLLDGIEQQELDDVEVVVVDSGSTDRTLDIVAQYDARVVSISPEEFSFGRSLNLGIESANGEIVVLASAHVYPVYRDWLARLTEPFTDPEVALAYGKQRGTHVTKYSEHRIFSQWFPDSSDSDQRTPFCNNANAAIRRSIWAEHPYDEALTGLEDIAWAKDALDAGHRIVYSADAEIIHVHDESWNHIYNRYRREAIALKRIFPSEHFHFWDFVRLFVTNVSNDWRHAWRNGGLWNRAVEIVSFRLMQFWGTYRGFQRHAPVDSQLKQTFYYPDDRVHQRARKTDRDAERVQYTVEPGERLLESR